MLDIDNDYAAIISDIEMPEVNGFQFAEQVQNSRHKHIPMIALTSHATERRGGKDAGFEEYVAKFDRNIA